MPSEKPEFVEGDRVAVHYGRAYEGTIIKSGRYCGVAQYLVEPDADDTVNSYRWFCSWEMRPCDG